MTDDDDVAGGHLLAEDPGDGVLLGLEDDGGPGEGQDRLVHAGGLDDAALLGNVAEEDGQAAVGGVGVLDVADAAGGAVGVEGLPAGGLGEHLGGAHAGGGGEVAGADLLADLGAGDAVGAGAGDVIGGELLTQGGAQDVGGGGLQQSAAVELAEDADDAAGAVDVLDVVEVRRGRDLGQVGDLAREAVDVGHGEVDLGLLGGGQQVQDGVGGAAHGDVQAHGVLEGGLGGDGARQDGGVVVLVVGPGDLDDLVADALEELAAVGVGGQQGAVHGQGQAEGLGEAVHGVGGEHARAGAAGGAGQALDGADGLIGHGGVGGVHHGVDEVELAGGAVGGGHLARLHGAAGDEDGRDVEPHGGHEHARGDLVAVGDAHEGVGAVGADHVLHGVGDEVAAGQGVEHAVVAHGDAVVDGDRVELLGQAPGGLDLGGHEAPDVAQTHVAGHELGEGVRDGDDRFAEVGVLDAGGAPQCTGARHVAAVGGGGAAVLRHERFLLGQTDWNGVARSRPQGVASASRRRVAIA